MLPFASLGRKVASGISLLMKQRKVRRSLAATVFFVILTLLISVDFMPQKVDLQLGDVSREDVYAPREVEFEDKDKTEERRQIAAANVEPQYEDNEQASGAVRQDITSVLESIKVIQEQGDLSNEEKEGRLRSLLHFSMSEQDLAVLARPGADSLKLLDTELNKYVAAAMEKGITQENLEETKKSIVTGIKSLHLDNAYINLGQGLTNYYLRPNKIFNEIRTGALEQAARESVPPVMVTIKQDEKIIGVGDVVKEEHMKKLEALGLTRSLASWRGVVGTALLVAILMLVVLFYLYQQNREIYKHAGHLYLLGIIVVVVLAVAKGLLAIDIDTWRQLDAQLGYMVPLAAGGMLIAILLDSRLAVLVLAIMSFLLVLISGGRIEFGMVGLISGFAGVYSVSKLSQRGDLVRAGLYTGAASVAAILTMGIIGNNSAGLVLSSGLILGTINGLLSSVLTIGALPYLESTFGITSSVRLLELSHPSNPLLKKLLTEAPGTYHHSILVANLAEAATEEVGGESLLVRVGAYYHDIGKIKRPYFFIENQMTSDNPHDKIAPSLSTLILTSHVKDGLELGREYKLPKDILDIIEQHHGSGMCSYFYHKALENNGAENVNEDEFRYEGPKPQTREAAIVMLADSVEAAVRSLQNRTHGRIEGLVRKIIKDKLLDGQLDECDLTFKDLDAIANSFLKVLSGIFHSRVEYPDMSKEMERRKNRNAGSRKQLAGKNPAQ
ncbi:membrane protein containing HD superfamily hydrolase [Desulfocucumis palustris]|uniref:Membrane protein containing HD superfamily hydrolase n=1 Tax=Desulfocucumis palustris TaxID=1898651 RepID=A0A2L2XCC6_9FIRM|nr:HDIG domain-containing metalloprotein [Desulfocucumis palustris]GBF33762.1 membrane protein containing HD superfamily hydrolase [Desulfocucumis palustris]